MGENSDDNMELSRVVEIIRSQERGEVSIILIGSAARGVRDENSDIDLLVLRTNHPNPVKNISGYHIQYASAAEFLRKLSAGEDFEGWSVRYGKILHDDGVWERIKSSETVSVWPNWRVKVAHGARRLLISKTLLQSGDKDAAAEEALYAAGHIARGILLRAGIFPLSRPELAEQVRKIGFPHLAAIHEELRTTDDVSERTISLAHLYSKKLLCHLDPDVYGQYATDYRRIRLKKAATQAAAKR
jgi:predicted nucleotidyltransferase